jgi:hypothetical protein
MKLGSGLITHRFLLGIIFAIPLCLLGEKTRAARCRDESPSLTLPLNVPSDSHDHDAAAKAPENPKMARFDVCHRGPILGQFSKRHLFASSPVSASPMAQAEYLSGPKLCPISKYILNVFAYHPHKHYRII